MSAPKNTDQLDRLPKEARERLEPGQLPGRELAVLIQKMYDATDPAEKKRWEDEVVRGFYGDVPHA